MPEDQKKTTPQQTAPVWLFVLYFIAAIVGLVEGAQKAKKPPPGDRRG